MSRVPVVLACTAALLALFGIVPHASEAQRATQRRELAFLPTEEGKARGMVGKIRLESLASTSGQAVEKVILHLEAKGLPDGAPVQVTALNPSVSPDPIVLANLVLKGANGKVVADAQIGTDSPTKLPIGLSPIATLTEMRVIRPGQKQGMLMYIVNHEYGSPEHSLPSLREWSLTPRPAANAGRAKAHVITQTESKDRQTFTVEVEAQNWPAGKKLEVYFSHCCNGRGQFLAGEVVLQARGKGKGVEAKATFRNSNKQSLPVGVSPVNGITAVWLVDESTQELLFAGAY